MTTRVAVTVLCMALSLMGAAAGVDKSVYMDPSKSVDERVAALVAQMTLEEKQAQSIHLTGTVSVEDMKKAYGATSLGAYPTLGRGSAESLAAQNALQAFFLNTSRLAIPVTFHTETLHSAASGSTIFPMPCLQGATWDTDLAHRVARSIAVQARANGVNRGFSPEINVCTDPRFGRTEENFGEDPALVAAMGVAAVTGLHAGNTGGPSTYLPPDAIVSEAKHAAAYGFGGKDGAAADLSEGTLQDVYLRPWREYARAGGRGAMLSHNSISGTPSHANAALMGQLRGWARAPGMLLASDMCDVGVLAHPTSKGFGVAADFEAAAVLAMTAGLDQELCNPTDGRGQAFSLTADAVRRGLLANASLDRAAANALREKFASGLFDRPFANTSAASLAQLDSADARALARQVAAEGIVLLKNDGGVLPLRFSGAGSTPPTIAILGALANDTQSQAGGYTSFGAPINTVLATARARLPPGSVVLSAVGANVTGNSTAGFAAAVAAAKQADVIVAVVGDSGAKGWNRNTCGEDDDRTMLDLPGVQPELLAAVAAAAPSTPLVVVLVHGRPVTFVRHNLLGAISGLVAAWRPGEEGGDAVWDVLLGAVSPSGRLTQAWVRSVGYVHSQASPWFHKRQGDFDEEAYRGGDSQQPGDHQSYPWGPYWPFGFGLSYTTFGVTVTGHSGLNITQTGSFQLTAEVSNTGHVAGKTVLALYFSKPLSRFVRYHKMLGTFAKTPSIASGASATVTLTLPAAALESYNPVSRALETEPGQYELTLAHDSASSLATLTLNVATTA